MHYVGRGVEYMSCSTCVGARLQFATCYLVVDISVTPWHCLWQLTCSVGGSLGTSIDIW